MFPSFILTAQVRDQTPCTQVGKEVPETAGNLKLGPGTSWPDVGAALAHTKPQFVII